MIMNQKLAGSAVALTAGLLLGTLAAIPAEAQNAPLQNQPANSSTEAQPIAGAAGRANQLWFDPRQLPQITGTVARFTLTPRGDIDGFILNDGIHVHVPPHLSTQVAFAVKPGDNVLIHGLRALSAPVVDAVTIADQRDGTMIVDNGPPPGPGLGGPPPGPRPDQQAFQVQGRVRLTLYGPRGEINGALLDNGAIIHLPPPQAADYQTLLQPGQQLAARGYGTSGVLGTSIDAREIGPSLQQLSDVAPPPAPGRNGPPPRS